MKDEFLKDIDNISTPKPFYKRKLFIIGILFLIIIISIIIIILVISSSSSSSSPSYPHYFNKNYFSSESKEFIKNPDQGFYRPLIIRIKPDSFSPGKNNPTQLYHLRCDISEFSGAVNTDKQDKKLTDIALNGLDEYLNTIKLENKNAIIRFSYDPNYGGKSNIEPSLEMIEEHIKQLGPIINKHLDVLTAVEAGMIGPWGEMHSSKIASDENKALVLKYWLENTNEIPILARTPNAIYSYFNKNLDEMEKYQINKNEKGYRLGLYNDCYLSSDNDVGTYTNRKREINWLSTQNNHLPYGGEVCQEHYMNNLENCLPEMRILSPSYINYEYNQKVIIEKWQNLYYNSSLGKDSLFYNVSGYDYINAHLGYRLVLYFITVRYSSSKFELTLDIKNVGFGKLLKSKNVDIIFTDMNETIISRNTFNKYNGEETFKITGELISKNKYKEYKVFLCLYGSIENNIVYYPIQFANDGLYNNKLKANYLFSVKDGLIAQK